MVALRLRFRHMIHQRCYTDPITARAISGGADIQSFRPDFFSSFFSPAVFPQLSMS